MKVASELYKGIYYVQISSLPDSQRNEILKSLSDRFIIKILKGDSILSDCVQYQHYEFWYENIFKIVRAQAEQQATVQQPVLTSFALTASDRI